jgi:hypothetical protein
MAKKTRPAAIGATTLGALALGALGSGVPARQTCSGAKTEGLANWNRDPAIAGEVIGSLLLSVVVVPPISGHDDEGPIRNGPALSYILRL